MTNYDRLRKLRHLSDLLNGAYSKYYAPFEHLVADKIVVLFKVRIIFKHCIPHEHKCFRIKIYKPCEMSGYTYDNAGRKGHMQLQI
jgi:hypothetical protein